MVYDNPFKEDGTKKRNRLLGDFDIIKTFREDPRTSLRYGTLYSKVYIIEGIEVSGINSGVRYQLYELPKIKRMVYV